MPICCGAHTVHRESEASVVSAWKTAWTSYERAYGDLTVDRLCRFHLHRTPKDGETLSAAIEELMEMAGYKKTSTTAPTLDEQTDGFFRYNPYRAIIATPETTAEIKEFRDQGEWVLWKVGGQTIAVLDTNTKTREKTA